jgi:poly(hydroxyalkanoate) depolymerase family esterase
MDARQQAAMAEATSLTRQGRLAEATALIQRNLSRSGEMLRPPAASYPGERAGATPSRLAVLPPPADEETPPKQTPPEQAQPKQTPREQTSAGWLRRLRDFAGRGAAGPVLTPQPAPPTSRPAPAAPPAAGEFGAFSYANAAGTRRYRLYVPSGYTGAPVPLVVMLHGGTQDGATFAAATGMNELAERETFLVAYPEQDRSANPGLYWNWFTRGHQRRDAGEPSLIAGITAEVMAGYHVAPDQVYVAGFSAGAAMAAVMGTVYPELYAAAGVHSGLAYGAASDLPSALTAMRQGPPRSGRTVAQPRALIVFHGDQDATVSPANTASLIGDALTPGPTIHGQVPGGRAYTRACYQDASGATVAECWTVHQSGHNWSGGMAHGSYTDPHGPDASAELIRFFREHPAAASAR